MNTEDIKNAIKNAVRESIKENLSMSQQLSRTLPSQGTEYTHMSLSDIHEVIKDMVNGRDGFSSNPHVYAIMKDNLTNKSVLARIFGGNREIPVEDVIDRLKHYIASTAKGGYETSTVGNRGNEFYGQGNGTTDAIKYLNSKFTKDFITSYNRVV